MKYRLKEPPEEQMRQYKEICIYCGKEQMVDWPKILPVPNMTYYSGKPSWFQCHILKQHYFYTEDRLEPNAVGFYTPMDIAPGERLEKD